MKTTVIVPAYNEEKYIKGVLGPIKDWQKRDPERRGFAVVDDGSTDKTREVVEREGVKVIKSHRGGKNVGKGRAVKAGLRHSKKEGSEVMVTLDADLIDVTPEKIEELVRSLHRMRYNMTIGRISMKPGMERIGFDANYYNFYSGQRAFKVSALEPWLKGNPKWKHLDGYGFEPNVNHLIKKADFVDVHFKEHDRTKLKGMSGDELEKQVHAAREFRKKRKEKAQKLRERRRK